MKKWQKTTLVILALGILGGVSTPFHTSVVEDGANREKAPASQSFPLEDAREKTGGLEVDYTWKFHAHPAKTLLLQDISPDAFSLLKEAEWNIRLEVKDEKLLIHSKAPVLHAQKHSQRVETTYCYEMLPIARVMRPDGTYHPVRTLRLGCEVRVYSLGKSKPVQTFAFQELSLDFVSGTADLISPVDLRLQHLDTPSRVILSQEDTKLPTLLCGSPCEQALTTILLRLSSIDSTQRARYIMSSLPKQVEETIKTYAAPEKDWPDCWGEEAETARRIARRIVPALLRFQKKDCYQFQPLADFINSPSFSRVFGESFADYHVPDTERESIPFERMQEDDTADEGEVSDTPQEK